MTGGPRYWDRFGAMVLAVTFLFGSFQTGTWYVLTKDPQVDLSWWQVQRLRWRDAKLGLLPRYRSLFGSNTLSYLRPGFSPAEMGSTAQAVAYLASSPAARAAHL